jgi:hypothetical protein
VLPTSKLKQNHAFWETRGFVGGLFWRRGSEAGTTKANSLMVKAHIAAESSASLRNEKAKELGMNACGTKGWVDVFGRRLFFCQTPGHDGGVEAVAKLGGDLVELCASVDFDGLVGGIEDYAAVLAARGVDADLFAKLGGELIVEVVGKMAQ